MHGRRTALAGALLAAVLAVTGCSANDSDGGSDGGDGAAAADMKSGEGLNKAQEAPAQEGGGSGEKQGAGPGGGTAQPVQLAPQALIRTAEVTVRTQDIGRAADEARTAAEDAGGYVGSESTSTEAGGSQRSRLTLRVPAEEYDTFLDRLADLGRVVDRDLEVRDVTDEVVDVDSRVKSQRASVDRIRRLMNEATKLGDVVTLEGELGTRQADLEALLARQAALEESTTLSTVTLELRRPGAAKDKDDDDGTTVGGALAGGWDAFVTALRAVAIGISAALPFAAAAALILVAWRVLRPHLPRRRVTPPPSPFPAQPTPQGSEET